MIFNQLLFSLRIMDQNTPVSTKKVFKENETAVPIWILAPHEEKALRDELQENTNRICADKFIKMGECTQKHQVLFSFYCSDLKKELLECVGYNGSRQEYDELRRKYLVRKKELIEKEGKLQCTKQLTKKH